ncbi:MAG: tRNA (N(6)-L-threonylcarbamoyladenosine(37)-C(2))-methylthiotransferase MtaB [Johnsonella sp.]|nr:tRNA (N(6)-L-threonylcarbamoyladenosine(37)-C(2))-methylthiotransferase MtaB [Johnsonella sp.]
MQSVAFHTLGCKVNIYETEAMQQLMQEAGYKTVEFEDSADIYIINTCSITNMADKKSRQILHRAKKENPNAIVVAVGCYVQSAAEQLKKDGNIDIIVGNNRKKDIAKIIGEYFCRQEQSYIIDINSTKEYEEFFTLKPGTHTRAFLKVQDGCNQFCTYCIIPYTRGRVRSRKKEEVLKEAGALAAAGYQELVLTGIHLSSYGMDFQDKTDLGELIEAISRKEGIERIRIGSLEPRIISEDFMERMRGIEQFCPHFHLSLQSGCDETLRRMNRHYNTEEYYRGVELIRKYYPKAALTTDIIVGFPGETQEEFIKSREFIEKVNFFETHIFPFSLRQGTKAAKMPGQIPKEEKNRRAAELAKINRRNREAFHRRNLGSRAELLVEERIEIEGVHYLGGHTKEYIRALAPDTKEGLNRILKGRLVSCLDGEHMLFEPDCPSEGQSNTNGGICLEN